MINLIPINYKSRQIQTGYSIITYLQLEKLKHLLTSCGSNDQERKILTIKPLEKRPIKIEKEKLNELQRSYLNISMSIQDRY